MSTGLTQLAAECDFLGTSVSTGLLSQWVSLRCTSNDRPGCGSAAAKPSEWLSQQTVSKRTWPNQFDVRLTPKADIAEGDEDARFVPIAAVSRCSKRAPRNARLNLLSDATRLAVTLAAAQDETILAETFENGLTHCLTQMVCQIGIRS